MTMTPPIKQRSAVIAAIVGMWLLASLGVFIVIRTGHWSIFPSDDKSATIAQVGAFYLAFFGAQLPAIAFVAFIISRSAFRPGRPSERPARPSKSSQSSTSSY